MAEAVIDPASLAQTKALRRVLAQPLPSSAVADFLFLEAWEWEPSDNAGVNLRIGQIRRANPALAAEIRAEIKTARAMAVARSIASRPIPNVKMSLN